MGKEVSTIRLPFISFEPKDKGFTAFLSMEGLISGEKDPELILQDATKLYEQAVKNIRLILKEIEAMRANHKRIPARKVWQLGNIIFELKDGLEKLSLQIDNIYSHLVRDLKVKRKWLEKVITLRRYISKEELIPETLNWGSCEKGTRRVAERIRDGLSLN